jgi:hypothetical protein
MAAAGGTPENVVYVENWLAELEAKLGLSTERRAPARLGLPS